MKKGMKLSLWTFLSLLAFSSWANAGNLHKVYVNVAKEGKIAQNQDIPTNYGQIETLMKDVIYNFSPSGDKASMKNGTTHTAEGLQMDGTDDFVETTLSTIPKEIATLEVYFKANDTVKMTSLIAQSNATYNWHTRGIRLQDNAIGFWSRNSSGVWQERTFSFTDTSKFHHAVLVQNGSVVTCYLDGTKLGSFDMGSFFHFGNYFTFGKFTHSEYNFPGTIHQVRVWNRALSDTEVSKYMNQTLTGYESGLLGIWK